MKNTSFNAIAALILGILSLVARLFEWGIIVGLTLGIVGIFIAIQAKKDTARGEGGRGLATAGLILSIIGTVLSAFAMMSCFVCTGATLGVAACFACVP